MEKLKLKQKKVKSSYKLNKLDKIYLYNISYKNFIKKKKIIFQKIQLLKKQKKI